MTAKGSPRRTAHVRWRARRLDAKTRKDGLTPEKIRRTIREGRLRTTSPGGGVDHRHNGLAYASDEQRWGTRQERVGNKMGFDRLIVGGRGLKLSTWKDILVPESQSGTRNGHSGVPIS